MIRKQRELEPTLSLWIVPPEPLREALHAIVRRFSRITGTPPFEPHVTLLGDILDPPPATDQVAREIASVGAFEVRFDGVGTGRTFFRSIFLRVGPSEGLLEARRAAERVFGGRAAPGREEETFEPHLSLVYGSLQEEARKELFEAVRRRGLDSTAFRADRITLAHSSSELPIEEWHAIEEFDLGARP